MRGALRHRGACGAGTRRPRGRARSPGAACRRQLVHDRSRHAHRSAGARGGGAPCAARPRRRGRLARACTPARPLPPFPGRLPAGPVAAAGPARATGTPGHAAPWARRGTPRHARPPSGRFAGFTDDTPSGAAQQARAHGARLPRDHALDRGDRGRALPLDEHGQDAYEEHLPQARRHAAAPRGLRGARPAPDLTVVTAPEPLPPNEPVPAAARPGSSPPPPPRGVTTGVVVAAVALALAVGGVLGWLVAESGDDSGGTTATVTSIQEGSTITTTETTTVISTETESAPADSAGTATTAG